MFLWPSTIIVIIYQDTSQYPSLNLEPAVLPVLPSLGHDRNVCVMQIDSENGHLEKDGTLSNQPLLAWPIFPLQIEM